MTSAILRKGLRGEQVRILQQKLKAAEFLPENPDGIFGERTEKAVIAFQKYHKLSVDGEVGKQTWAKLNEVPAC